MNSINPLELFGKEYAAYQIRRSPLRKAVRRLYLRNILKHVKGKTVDLGCGCGELLALLPAGSLGLEVNPAAVAYCAGNGLNVKSYDPGDDCYEFREIAAGAYTTLVMVHVLEHIAGPHEVIEQIGRSCAGAGMERIIFVVPGPRGFRHDATHRVFLDINFFERHRDIGGFALVHREYFPLNFRWAGRIFTHNELMVSYDRAK